MTQDNDETKNLLHDLLFSEDGHWLSDSDIELAESGLIEYARAHSVNPPSELKQTIMNRLNKLQANKHNSQHIDLRSPPLLDEESNWQDWQRAVEHIEIPSDFENIHLHPLESNEQRELFLAWVKDYVPEEVHYDLIESILILEGSCECLITAEDGKQSKVRLGPGEFISMKIGETHDIKITSSIPAKAILQWKKLAA